MDSKSSKSTQLYRYRAPDRYREISEAGTGAAILRLSDCRIGEHSHGEAEISMLFRGRRPSVVAHDECGNQVQADLQADSVTFMPSFQPHRLRWRDQGELVNLYMSGPYLEELVDSLGFRMSSLRLISRPRHALHQVGSLLLDEFHCVGALSPALIDHATALLLRPILRSVNTREARIPASVLALKRLQPAIDLLHAHPERDMTLLQLAQLCHSSPYHFARSFSAQVGAAPFALQRKLRIDKATQLLAEPGLSIEAVASAVGFKSAGHFSRTFQRYVGCSPRAYRNSRLAPE